MRARIVKTIATTPATIRKKMTCGTVYESTLSLPLAVLLGDEQAAHRP